MVEDLAALNRRSQLPVRIIQDRPHGKNKKILRGEIKKEEDPYGEVQETHTISNTKTKHPPQEGRKKNRSQKRRQKELSASYRSRQAEGKEEQRNKEENMEQEIIGTDMPLRRPHMGATVWQKGTAEQ